MTKIIVAFRNSTNAPKNLCALPTQSVLCVSHGFLQQIPIIYLHSINTNVFVLNTGYIYCTVPTAVRNILQSIGKGMQSDTTMSINLLTPNVNYS